MYATTTTGHQDTVTKAAETRTLQRLRLNVDGSVYAAAVVQTTVTTTETWTGLSQTDAGTLCTSSETSTLNGTTRAYLGSVRLTNTGGSTTQRYESDGCWGTRVSTNMSRINGSHLYQVTRTTTVMTVTNSGGTMELL